MVAAGFARASVAPAAKEQEQEQEPMSAGESAAGAPGGGHSGAILSADAGAQATQTGSPDLGGADVSAMANSA